MKVRITDKEALLAITPAQLTTYLRSKGARQAGEFSGKAAGWNYGREELLVPLATCFADYAARVAEILAALEREEGRSQLQILADLQYSGYDIVRVRSVCEETRTGTLNFLRCVDFVARTRDLLLAAACSAATHRLSYPGRKPQEAQRFLESLRFGQMEQGSFALQILSPVAPHPLRQGALNDQPEGPYEERVIPTLQSGLQALNAAVQQTGRDAYPAHFHKAAQQGVTTNLCDALTGMFESLRPQSLAFSLTYSAHRQVVSPHVCLSVDAGTLSLIREVSACIRETEPEPEQLVRGLVTGLDSECPGESGQFSIKDVMAVRPRVLFVQLSGQDYKQALFAHAGRKLVELTGTITRSGHTLRLVAESPLTIVDDDA